MKVIYIIDSSGLIFRAFYSLPSLFRSDGVPVGAVFGFCSMLLRLRDFILDKSGQNEVMWLSAFDVARKNFRHEIFREYKANRGETPKELIPQFSLIREACIAFGCNTFELPGFEADDVIASYVNKAKQQGIKAVVVSSDKDLMQLYSEGTVEIFDPMKFKWIKNSDIVEKFGVPAHKVIDVQSLAGDQSDGVKGVPGIGVKIAAELINQFGSLETLLQNAHSVPQKKRREALISNAGQALIAKQLVTLKDDLAVEIDEKHLQFEKNISEERVAKMLEFCKIQGFTDLQRRVQLMLRAAPSRAVGGRRPA
jgi:DNA polymerase-1